MAYCPVFRRIFSPACLTLAALAALVSVTAPAAKAQIFQRNVAGVWIDANNILRNQERDETNALRAAMIQSLKEVPGGLDVKSDLRKISLRRLEAAIADCLVTQQPLPDEIKYLAGIQKIRYVFVYPEQQDIVIAGPGEGWKVNDQGEVVGKTTGKPVMLLDDLLVALRSAERAQQEGISCSINPTAEGLARLKALAKSLQPGPSATDAIENTLGMQDISITGLPTDSHMARVIVAADYKMKRLAMNFDPSPVQGMPSYMQMIGTGRNGVKNMLPRWWLAPNYDALLVDPDGLAWEFRGAGVKCVAEEDFLAENGELKQQKKVGGPIKKWADTMTAKYEELSAKDVVFAQLRNCIDLAVVAALITKERLPEKTNYQFASFTNDRELATEQFHVPRHVPSKASVQVKTEAWLISASGGVQIESWAIADKTVTSDKLAPVRKQAVPAGKNWWWN